MQYTYLPLTLEHQDVTNLFDQRRVNDLRLQLNFSVKHPSSGYGVLFENLSDLYVAKLRNIPSGKFPFVMVSKMTIAQIKSSLQTELEEEINGFYQSIVGVFDFSKVLASARKQELVGKDFHDFLERLVADLDCLQESDLLKQLFICKSTSPVSPVSEKERNALSKHWQNGNGLGHHQQAGPSNGHHSPTASC